MRRLLLFSRSVELQRSLRSSLGREYDVAVESNPSLLKQVVEELSPDLVLLDIDPSLDWTEGYLRLCKEMVLRGIPVAVMMEDTADPVAGTLLDTGARVLCRKPLSREDLRILFRPTREQAVKECAQHGTGPLPESSYACDALIGRSPAMHQVYEVIRRVTSLCASVLITGESGTGKELIARAIHNLGARRGQPFVAVSCGAVPETLIESELFGHEKGAFTGTVGNRVGYFEQAAGGTLFLDEIGELSPQTQVKLLRALQQREFARLGSSRPIPLKARLIFATHRNLPRLIEEGKFRLDLYYRLNVITIHSPTLAERPEDVGLLARHFLSQYANQYDKNVRSITPAALKALEDYEWPGNVRELENIIQRAVIWADANEVQLSNLPPQIQAAHNVVRMEDINPTGTFERLLRDYRVKLAMRAVEEAGGNKTVAARGLDITRAYLHRLLLLGDRMSEQCEPMAELRSERRSLRERAG